MSASHASNEHENHETHPHPPMPAVTDEAADTPMWVPISGVVMFALLVLYVMIRSSLAAPEVVPGSDVTDEAHAAEGVVVMPAAQ
jgi:hypothetical protein